jgi:glyoxylate carboligase
MATMASGLAAQSSRCLYVNPGILPHIRSALKAITDLGEKAKKKKKNKRRINQKVKWNDEIRRRRRRMSSAQQLWVQRYGHVKALNVFSFYDSRYLVGT